MEELTDILKFIFDIFKPKGKGPKDNDHCNERKKYFLKIKKILDDFENSPYLYNQYRMKDFQELRKTREHYYLFDKSIGKLIDKIFKKYATIQFWNSQFGKDVGFKIRLESRREEWIQWFYNNIDKIYSKFDKYLTL